MRIIMTDRTIKMRVKEAIPKIRELLSTTDYYECRGILFSSSMTVVNTIELLMYMGREVYYERYEMPCHNPVQEYREWIDFMKAYDNTNKTIEVNIISGKVDHKKFISTALKYLNVDIEGKNPVALFKDD